MLVHKHVIIRAEVNNPLNDEEKAKEWILKLIDKIGMKLCAGPIAKYVNMEGNKGVTVAAIIETSHIACHIWDEPDAERRSNDTVSLMQYDLYTCGPLDLEVVFDDLKQFDPVKIEYKYLDREFGLREIAVD